MKKIAVVFYHMVVGGAERSLIEFLKTIDQSKYQVTLYTREVIREYKDEIPHGIEIVNVRGEILPSNPQQLLKEDIRHFRVCSVAAGIYYRIRIRTTKNPQKYFYFTRKVYRIKPESYDCVISYKPSYDNILFPLIRLKTNKYCLFFHSTVRGAEDDRQKYDSFANNSSLNQMALDCFGKVFCVSESVQQSVNRQYPFLANKTEVFYNIFDIEKIRLQAQESVPITMHKCSIVSVGRLSREKGQTLVPHTARLLLKDGCQFKWYLIGDGPAREEIERQIELYGVQDQVVLLGTKPNPYPYMKNCLIYVQPSFSEGFCTATVEAKILGKPVVTTDVSGMREQFVDGANGLIVDEITSESLYRGIKYLLDHPEVRQRFTEHLAGENCDNSTEMEKLYRYIEEK